ncbi:MAG TPA: chromosome segregation protein SMC [Candidatus Obscuribacterales bacterium]
MRIKEIELDNFKSFGKLTKVPLLDGFTTISGPNGSGKSNIIDSLLFALGLSSTRTMRAERLPDLLNNLSGRNEARVTVRFTNDAGIEIEVTRRLRVKENSYTSTYFLNGKVATLTEIHEELAKYNVSPHGFNVIMQGDVTGIVTMSGTERRKIIDELAGVAEFDRRIEQAQKELMSVAEKVEHQKIVLAEIDGRLEVLQADRDQALKYLDLKTQKEKVERDLAFIRVKEIEQRAAHEAKEIQKLYAKEEKLGEAREKAEIDLFTLRSEIGRLDEEIREKGGNEQLLLRQELENQRGELTREENKLSNLDGVIGEKSKSQASIVAQIKTIDKHLRDLEKQKKQHTDDLKASQLVMSEKQGALQAVMAEIEVLRQNKDRASSKVVNLHEELQKLREEKHKLEVRRTELVVRKDSLDKELEGLRTHATSSISKAASLKALLNGFERNDDQQAMLVGLARNIRQMEAEIESTQEEIETKRHELDVINRRLIQLETTREVAGDSGYGRAVDTIMAAGIPGVHGTIGQLGRVDERYTTALEIAIGGRMGHIVVEDDEVASRCIEHLKQSRAGRATFVPLNKIQAQPPGLLPTRPGVIDFAYNLIDFNPKFVKAFQYACGQTVVVDSLDTARKLMNSARLVTLDGELLEKYGTMAGGGGGGNRLRFSQKDDSDLGALRQKSKNIQEDIKYLQDSIKELNAQLVGDRQKLNESQSGQAQKAAEFEAKKAELAALEKEIEELKPRLRASGDEIETVEVEVNKLDTSIAEQTKLIDKMQDELSSLTTNGNRSEVDRLISESEDLKSDLDQIEKGVKEFERQLDRIETEMRVEQGNRGGLQEQLDTFNREIDELSKERPQFEQRINELKTAIQEMERKSAELSDELQKLHDEKTEVQEKITAVEIEKTKIDQSLVHLEEERLKRKAVFNQLNEDLERLRAELAAILEANPDFQPPSAGAVEELTKQVERLEKRMRALEPVNMKALEEYNQTKERKEELESYLNTLETEKDEIHQRIAGYDELKKRTFMEAFDAINKNFQDIFAELSHGTGRLELENPESPFEGGLILRAQPRDKKMQRIEALSGGEKSLTALSFVFAFQRYAPAPFYAFDEVDMMLDGANADRLARMVCRQSNAAQFVVVSLRRPMIENADHAIGVSLKADGFSKVVGISEINIPTVPTPVGEPVGA